MNFNDELQTAVRKLFDEGRIEYFLGFARDAGHTFPVILMKGADLSKLAFDHQAWNNLCDQLPEVQGAKVGILVKRCERNALNVLAAENQIVRENVVIVGVGCLPTIDPRKLAADAATRDMNDPALWQEKCRRCVERNTPDVDVFVGEKISTPAPVTGWPLVEEFEKKPPAARLAWVREQMSLCIRCYACRLACPLCFCKQCFVEDNKPQWLDKSVDVENNLYYHLIRAVHLAGRCIECQECLRACPVGIPVDLFNQVLTRDFAARFGFTAGATPEQKAALIDYQRDDQEDFIL
jgi:formate dehydrogenase subunit beta